MDALREAEAALRKIAALREHWETAAPPEGWDTLSSFWEAVAIADAYLAGSAARTEMQIDNKEEPCA